MSPTLEGIPTSNLQPGAAAYKASDGFWHYANPNSFLYSTITMVASHFWNSEMWVEIMPADETDEL